MPIVENPPKHGSVLSCGHVLMVPAETLATGTGATGYGVQQDGATLCYECCAAQDRAALAAGHPMTLYLSSDGQTVGNWPGEKYMVVTRRWHTMAGGFSHSTITRVWARAFDGSLWYGSGPGRGMYIRMKRSKQRTTQR